MISPDEHGQENRALEALIAAALRKREVDSMSVEKLHAFEQDLSPEDRAALDALGPHLIAQVVSRRGRESRERRSSSRLKTRREHSGRVESLRLQSEGVKIMKSLFLSALVISGLAVAIVIWMTMDDPSSELRDATFDEGKAALLEGRLESIESRLQELRQLEEKVDRIVAMVSQESRLLEDRSPPHGEKMKDEAVASDSERPPVGETKDGEDLRSYIVQVLEEVRQERIAEQRRLAEERQREFAALREGPYGQHNFKVNSMAKRLDLSDAQKQHYYLNLVEYNNMIQRSREEEKEDKENRQRYRDQRKEIRKEFVQVITASLDAEQAESFTSLPENEQRPDTSSYSFGYYSTRATRSISPAPGSAAGLINIVEPPPPVEVRIGTTEDGAVMSTSTARRTESTKEEKVDKQDP